MNNFFISNFEENNLYKNYNVLQYLNFKIYYNNNCKILLKEDLIVILVGTLFKEQNLLELYYQFGEDIFKKIEGEFSLIIFDKDKLLLGSDTFGTKPLFFHKNNKDISISDYYSSLKNSYRVYENTRVIFDNNKMFFNESFIFNFEEKNDNIHDWEKALYNSIQKRIKVVPSLFLSDGIDSGSIACALKNKNINFKAYSFLHDDDYNRNVFNRRADLHECIFINEKKLKNKISFYGDNCASKFNRRLNCFQEVNFLNDNISIRLMDFISKENDSLIITGCGACFTDIEINNLYHKVNNIRGINYDNPILLHYLCQLYKKNTTFILLDRDLIQEMLWLRKDIYKEYKQPAIEFMEKYNYPFSFTIDSDFFKHKLLPRRGLINKNDYI